MNSRLWVKLPYLVFVAARYSYVSQTQLAIFVLSAKTSGIKGSLCLCAFHNLLL